MILNSSDNTQLVKSIEKEKEKQIVESNIENRKVIDIWTKAFLYHKDVDNAIVPFPQVAPEFLIKMLQKNFN